MTRNQPSTNVQPNFGTAWSPQSGICGTPMSTPTLSSNPSSSPGLSILEFDGQTKLSPLSALKPVHEYNLQDCCEFLQSIQLEEYIPTFKQNKMDGILLSCLVRDQIRDQILSNMGITDPTTIDTLVKATKKLVNYNS